MPVYPGAQDLHLQAVEHARRTKEKSSGAQPLLHEESKIEA
jgi:hypothetical protein